MKIKFPKYERGPHRGRYIDPIGKLEGAFDQLLEAGCIQAENREMRLLFNVLMGWTNKNPCAGCPVWHNSGPACVAFQKYHSAYRDAKEKRQQVVKDATIPNNVPAGHPLAGLSVKKIAEKLGVSIGEVRRRKASGTL